MLLWTVMAFVLGILNLVGSRLNYTDPFFMQLNGYIFLLIGFGQLIRMHYRKREGRVEKLEERVRRLESSQTG